MRMLRLVGSLWVAIAGVTTGPLQAQGEPLRYDHTYTDQQDALYADEMNAFMRTTYAPRFKELLSEFGDGRGKTVIVTGASFDPVMAQVFADWVGPTGSIHLAAPWRDPANYLKQVDRANVRVVDPQNVRAGTYDIAYSHRMLYPASMNDEGKINAHLTRLRALPKPGGRIVMDEYDFSGWYYMPPAPAMEKLRHRLEGTLKNNFWAARKLPEYFRRMGMMPTLRMHNAVIPANSWLGRNKPLSRARGYVISGGWKDKAEAEALIAAAEKEVTDPYQFVTTPVTVYAYATTPN